MRRAAVILSLLAGMIALGISVYLLVVRPAIQQDWLGVWASEMEIGSPFTFGGAATILGVLGLVFTALVFLGAWLIPRRFVAGGLLVVALDMVALVFIAACPDPRTGVFVWAVPGLLMALVGFLLGMYLERVHEPEGVSELL